MLDSINSSYDRIAGHGTALGQLGACGLDSTDVEAAWYSDTVEQGAGPLHLLDPVST